MPEITHLLRIKSSGEKVSKCLTTLDGLKGWWTPETSGLPVPGGELKFQFGPDYYKLMTVVEIEPAVKIVWKCTHGVAEWIGTVIQFDLKETDGVTTVRFNHFGWKEYSDMLSQCSYDWALFLRSLKKLCETGEGQPYPQQSTY